MMKHWLYIIILSMGIPIYAQQTNSNYPASPIAREYIRLAEGYFEQGKINKAMKQLDECIESAPITYAYWLRGSNLYKKGKWKKSIEDLTIVVADSVGISADIRTTAKTMLAQAKKKRNEQRAKRIGRLGIYGATYTVVSGVVQASKIIKQSADSILINKRNAAIKDSTAVENKVEIQEKNHKRQ